MEAVAHSNPSGAKRANGMLPKMLPASCYSVNGARDKILIAGRYSQNGDLFISTQKSHHENTKLKKHENFIIFFAPSC
jgi:hypothetical protein